MSTDLYIQLVHTLDRYSQDAGYDARAVTAAAARAFAEPHFRDALERLLSCDPGGPSVGRFYRALASLPADDGRARAEIFARLADGSPESDALNRLLTAAADTGTGCNTARPITEEVVAAILAAVLIERSSLGDRTARQLRDQTAHGDVVSAVQAWRHLAKTRENCTVFLTDAVGFGDRRRTDSDRLLIREVLFRMTQAAIQGIPDAHYEDRGDGVLTVVPPSVSTARVINQLRQELPAALERHNSTQHESARFKLRLAINVGPVASDAMGVSGEAIIATARLVEAPSFKKALDESTASLGIIASPFVYETVIRHGAHPREAASYSPVMVKVKETHTEAWMK